MSSPDPYTDELMDDPVWALDCLEACRGVVNPAALPHLIQAARIMVYTNPEAHVGLTMILDMLDGKDSCEENH